MKSYKRNYKSKATRMEWYKRNQCLENDIPYDLDSEWLYERLAKGCELTGRSFELDTDRQSPFSPSIDRLVSDGGYTKDNCRLILNGLNMLNGSGTDEQMFEIAEALVMGKQEPILLTEPELRYELGFHFTDRQINIIVKRKNGEVLTKTEKEYYSRTIKKRLKLLYNMDIEWVQQIIQ